MLCGTSGSEDFGLQTQLGSTKHLPGDTVADAYGYVKAEVLPARLFLIKHVDANPQFGCMQQWQLLEAPGLVSLSSTSPPVLHLHCQHHACVRMVSRDGFVCYSEVLLTHGQ